ncbi:MAG TPA: GntR family transcriptional regulator [Allosphingosinicella sp.]|nr:GntR family transcriptional regulator [Allosphingosinicella sp.]
MLARSDRDESVNRLRAAIISGRFMPNERLVEQDLVEFLGANRANVRIALGKLEQEGLVISEPNRGARVRLVTDQEAIEITQARGVLEGLVARQAAERATDADRKILKDLTAQMQAAHAEGDLIGFSAINGHYHAEIHRISGNATATRLLATLKSQIVRFQYRTIMLAGRAARSLQEHVDITEAIVAGDSARAERVMQAHLEEIIAALRIAMAKTERVEGL